MSFHIDGKLYQRLGENLSKKLGIALEQPVNQNTIDSILVNYSQKIVEKFTILYNNDIQCENEAEQFEKLFKSIFVDISKDIVNQYGIVNGIILWHVTQEMSRILMTMYKLQKPKLRKIS